MKQTILANMSVPQLVEHFTAICLEQYNAELREDTTNYNLLFDDLVRVKDELKARAGDQRKALVPLLTHQNPQVRLKAALYSLAVVPATARQALQKISDRNEYPQAAYARQTLDALDSGTSKLL